MVRLNVDRESGVPPILTSLVLGGWFLLELAVVAYVLVVTAARV